MITFNEYTLLNLKAQVSELQVRARKLTILLDELESRIKDLES